MLSSVLFKELRLLSGLDIDPASCTSLGRSSFSQNWCVQSKNKFFLKVGCRSTLDRFEAEADSLEAIMATRAIKVPKVSAVGSTRDTSFLMLEWLDLVPIQEDQTLLGQHIAAMHRYACKDFGNGYGWKRDNYLGSTLQPNHRTQQWLEFLRDQRLQFQLDLLKTRSHAQDLIERVENLIDHLDKLTAWPDPVASLLHGDLWCGNVGYLADGSPVIFDPAVYHGDAEMDLAMAELFGGFNRSFYKGYRDIFPDTDGASVRRSVYRLYHLLNHCNLFGAVYHQSTHDVLKSLGY